MDQAPESARQLSFGALVREYILPYNTLFAISGVLAFILGLISPALVIGFGALLLSVNGLMILANIRKDRLVGWASREQGYDRIDKRLIRLVWPSRESTLRNSGLFWVFFVTGVAVTVYGTTGAFEKGWAAARASRDISAMAASGAQDGAPRVLVLPFSTEAVTSDKKVALLGGGIHDDIIAGLSRFSSVRVLGRNTSAALAASSSDHAAVRDKFAVKYLVSGRFLLLDDQFRLDLELAETGTGTTVWSDRLTGPVSDVINVGEEVVRMIVGQVAAQIMHTELRASRVSRSSTLSAYELTLQGRHLWRKPTRENLPQAQSLLRKAMEIDAAYAPAYAYLAFTHLTSYNNSWADGFSRPETLKEMLKLAAKAIELEPQNATGHAAQAIAYTYLGRHDEALIAAREALRLNGSESDNLARVGQVLSFSGEHESAIKVLQNASELDPLGPAQLLNFLSRAYFFVGNHDAAISHARRCIERANIEPCRETLAAASAFAGKSEEAAVAWAEIVKKQGDMEPVDLVARLKSAFKKPQDLERLATGLRQARQAARMRAEQ